LAVPVARQRSPRFLPVTVPTRALPQYVVVHALYRLLDDAVTRALHGATEPVAFRSGDVVELVRRTIGCVAAAPWNQRPFGVAQIVDTDGAALTQLVSATLHQLVAEACKAQQHAREQGSGVGDWAVSFEASRAKGDNLLHVADCARADACRAFLDFCGRVKSHLDESWPMPDKSSWRVAARGATGPKSA
jgi:hypothetical protein